MYVLFLFRDDDCSAAAAASLFVATDFIKKMHADAGNQASNIFYLTNNKIIWRLENYILWSVW